MRSNHARVLAEGRSKAELFHERAHRSVPFAIRIGEERGIDAQLLLETPLRPQQVGPVRVRVGLPQLSVRCAVIADGHARSDQLAQLVPSS